MDLNILFWANTKNVAPSTARDEALIRIKESFEKNGVEISRPVQVQIEAGVKTKPKRKTK